MTETIDPDTEFESLPSLSIEEVTALSDEIIDNVESVIVGKETAVEDVLVTILARGHLLIEDVPGVGKTMLSRAIARSLNCSFNRVQFTPDLLASDITGVNVYNRKTGDFEFQPGPVFANIVLGDEINRAPPKTQSALLEAMEEEQVTVDGETRPLPDPFIVIATQNNVEPSQTYDLPIAQIDRFMKKLSLGYPDNTSEIQLLDRTVGIHPIRDVEPVASVEKLKKARATVAEVDTAESVRSYVTAILNYTREHASLGVSPRGGIALLRASQARAVLDGRDYVIPDDIQYEAESVLAHRIRTGANQQTGIDIVKDAIDSIPVE